MVKSKKKRTIKKALSKKVKKKYNSIPSSLRRDFETFSRGIERLEELKQELESLNTKGYGREVSAIKLKLKNVSEIPSIERDLKALKNKINSKYKTKKRTSIPSRKLKELEDDFEKKVAKYRRDSSIDAAEKLDTLKKEINKKTFFCKAVDFNTNENDSNLLVGVGGSEKDLYNYEENRKKEILDRVDPSVNLLHDEDSKMSLQEVRAKLSGKAKQKETELQKKFHNDLILREQLFKKKYKDLEEKYHKLYEKKVNNSLKQESKKKFNELLKKRMKEQKADISRKELEKLKLFAEQDFKNFKIKLKKDFDKKLLLEKEHLRQHFEDELLVCKNNLRKDFENMIISEVSRLRDDHNSKEKIVNEKIAKKEKFLNDRLEKQEEILTKEEESLNKNYAKKQGVLENVLSKNRLLGVKIAKTKLDLNFRKSKLLKEENKLKLLRKRFDFDKKMARKSLEKEKEEMKKRLEREKNAQIKRELAQKVSQAKALIQEDYKRKFQLELRKKEALFEQKKAELEQEVREKAKKLFG